MLVLARKSQEEVVIGEGETQVSIRVLDIKGNTVRLGFDADRSVVINRKEVLDALKAE